MDDIIQQTTGHLLQTAEEREEDPLEEELRLFGHELSLLDSQIPF